VCDKTVYAFNRNAINRIRLYQFSNAKIDNSKLLIIRESSKKLHKYVKSKNFTYVLSCLNPALVLNC